MSHKLSVHLGILSLSLSLKQVNDMCVRGTYLHSFGTEVVDTACTEGRVAKYHRMLYSGELLQYVRNGARVHKKAFRKLQANALYSALLDSPYRLMYLHVVCV